MLNSTPNVRMWIVGLLLTAASAATATTVTSLEDSGPGSLRQAILDANPGEFIFFNLGAGAHTINLAGALPDLGTDLYIVGPGPDLLTVRRDTGGDYRIFTVPSGSGVWLYGMTLANGSMPYPSTSSQGGGIHNRGSLYVLNCTLSGNSAIQGSGIFNSGTLDVYQSTLSGNSDDGISNEQGTVTLIGSTISGHSEHGIYNTGTLIVSHCTIRENGGGGYGGGIQIDGGTVTIDHSAISENRAGDGGGISNGGTLTVTNSTLSGNTAGYNGGGIFNGGTLTVTNCTLTGNIAYSFYGGGIFNGGTATVENSTLSRNRAFDGSLGGGIGSLGGTLDLRNSTISGNNGGGIVDYGASVTVTKCTISGNSGGGIYGGTVSGSIVALNTPDGSFTDGGYNFIGGDPMLGPLTDNGGPTQTMALLPGSPCIDAGDPAFAGPPDYDQRGAPFARVGGPTIDIGAFEVQPVTQLVDNTGDASDGDRSPLQLTLREAIELANADPATDIIGFDPAVFSTPQTINLTGALPDLSSDMLIQGPGANLLTVRRDTGGNYRIFTVIDYVHVVLSGMTIANGFENGGGILNDYPGTLLVSHCAISGNSAGDGSGGGIANAGTLTVTSSTLSGNQAYAGGGIMNVGTLAVTSSTLSANSASQDGGGIMNGVSGTTVVTSSTLSGNSAIGGFNASGGGIFNYGTLVLNNSIVALNTAPSSPDFEDFAYGYGGSFNFIGGDPMLGPLSDNGGPTPTMALLEGSPCIHAGDPHFYPPPGLDQRGLPRVSGFGVDIGAYEYAFNDSLVVTTTADEDDGNSDAAYGAGTSLREAIRYANLHDGADTITFALGRGAHTINLTGALPDLATDMDITGPGEDLLTIRRDTGGEYRIFNIPLGTIALSGMTIANGHPSASGFAGNSGGGILNSGTLSVSHCTLSGNSAGGGGGITNTFGMLTVTSSTLSGNSAIYRGGGIFNDNGSFTFIVSQCIFSDNSAGDLGGGIFDPWGGGHTIINSTLTGNSAGSSGGGIYHDSLFAVSHCTLSGNSAAVRGGGIYRAGGSTVVTNSIVALNTADSDPDYSGPYGGSFSGSFNFIGGDPKLGPLADNGGPTRTMALLPRSPCINAGDPVFVPPPDYDQRGAPHARVRGGRIDIGAFESRPQPRNPLISP